MSKRPEKTDYYLNIAREVSKRSTCLRRRFGAVILKNDQIISTGYVGAPRGTPNCLDLGKCLRQEMKIPAGERYELCRSVHAEMNAIINAARSGVSLLGGTLYLYGENVEDDSIAEAKPCRMCKRMIINSGLKDVIVKAPQGEKTYSVDEWIKEDTGVYTEQELKGY
ncbi:MAG: cytidine/deoxycytidylate deaminase family protein [Candidatus Aenigmarchaeota archaeon]|nr:cytidine/deoxycytidylate deaminase family protein [Candidatus Aenigmarchaeota archaeon]